MPVTSNAGNSILSGSPLLKQLLNASLFFLPEPVQPVLKTLPKLGIALVITAAQVIRHRQQADVYANLRHTVGQILQKPGPAVRVDHGDIDNGVDAVTQSIQHQCGTTAAWFQQMYKR